jgi:hypothetical protein
VIRLPGATKKGVYRAVFADDSTAIVYIWDEAEDYWPAAGSDYADPFSHASGLALFQTAQARLSGLGVRTPQLYLADASREQYPADVAVLEDVPGPTLEDVLTSPKPLPVTHGSGRWPRRRRTRYGNARPPFSRVGARVPPAAVRPLLRCPAPLRP